jgi:hypothetical protein
MLELLMPLAVPGTYAYKRLCFYGFRVQSIPLFTYKPMAPWNDSRTYYVCT